MAHKDQNVCVFNKYGYCKFKSTCRSKHILERTWKDFGALPIEASICLVVHQSEANLTFLLDFVSLKKRIMSEGFWFFTLKMIKPASRNRYFP